MSKKNENKLIPKLRFPEFVNDVEWSEEGIRNKFDFKQGVQVPLESQYLIYQAGLVRFIRIIDVTNKEEPHRYIENPGNEHLIGENDLFMIRYGTPGIVSIGYKGVIANNLFRLIWNNDDFFIPYYWFYSLQKKEKTILELSGSSSMPAISFSTLESLKVQFPLKSKEQQKIASCLTSLDEVITNESQKLEVLKEHKKGLLKNLLPQEGETVPRFRFKEYKGDWKKIILGELIEINGRIGYRGYTINDIVEKGKGAITLSPSNINDNNQLNFDKATYISWEKYFESPEIILQDGYTVLVKTGSSFGKAAFIDRLPEKTTINPQLVVLKPGNINAMFLFILVCTSSIQRQIKEAVVGGAIPTLSQESISKFEVFIPPDQDKKEQKRIANTLSSIDELINVQKQKVDALKRYKNGLMQGLFPEGK